MTQYTLTYRTIFEDNPPLYTVLPALDELRRTNCFTDVQIELSDGEKCVGHSVLLAARIPALKEELLLDGSKKVLQWTQSDRLPTAATAIIDYAYTGKLDLSIDSVEGILGLANDLELGIVSKWCEEFLYSLLNPDTLSFVWRVAGIYMLSSLARACIRTMQEAFQHLICGNFFTTLSLDALIRVVQSEDLNVQTEDQVVWAILQWRDSLKNSDGKERLPELLREIRWDAVSNEIRERFASDKNWLKIFPYFRNSMKECEFWCGNANHRLTPSPFNQKARFYNKKVTFLMGYEGRNHLPEYTFAVHDVSKLRENKIICQIRGRRYALTVAFRDKVVIIGGFKKSASNAITIFDVPTQRVKPAAPMSVPQIEYSAAQCVDYIVVFGGKDAKWRSHATCELFRPLKNTWKQLPSSQTAHRGAAMVSLEDGRVLLLGGQTDNAALAMVKYAVFPINDWRVNTADTSDHFWHLLAPMHEARASSGACVLHGRAFVAGGVDGYHGILHSVEYFETPKDDIGAGYWTVVQGMNKRRDTFSLLALENRLYAFGADRHPENTIECFGSPGEENTQNLCGIAAYADWQWSEQNPVDLATKFSQLLRYLRVVFLYVDKNLIKI